ncbi:MAG: DUF2937 family protein [Pseudomonadota bacterium]
MIRKLFIMIVALAGAGTMSQAPEFAQQYRQALSGAVAELEQVANDFDAASARAGLTREQALAHYQLPDNSFLSDRGRQIASTLERYQALVSQQRAFEDAGSLERVWLVASSPDVALVRGVQTRFEPAVPLTVAGLIMVAIGFLLGWMLARFALATGRSGVQAVRKMAPGPRTATL